MESKLSLACTSNVAPAVQYAKQGESVVLARVVVNQSIRIDDGNTSIRTKGRSRRSGAGHTNESFDRHTEATAIVFRNEMAGFACKVGEDFTGVGFGIGRDD